MTKRELQAAVALLEVELELRTRERDALASELRKVQPQPRAVEWPAGWLIPAPPPWEFDS